MKLFMFAVLFSFVLFAEAMDKDEIMKMAEMMINECKVKEGATDDDAKQLMTEQLPDTHEGRCILACINEKMGIVSCS